MRVCSGLSDLFYHRKIKIQELAALFEPLSYKLVDGDWTRPDDPTWKLPEAGTGGR